MGAIYQAAFLTKSFKVKPFAIEELHLYPVEIMYTSGNRNGEIPTQKNSIIFHYKTSFPSKMISFTSYVDDFNFNVNYNLSHLSSKQLL